MMQQKNVQKPVWKILEPNLHMNFIIYIIYFTNITAMSITKIDMADTVCLILII